MNRDRRLRLMEGSWPTLSEQDELFNNLRDQWERPSRASQYISIPLQHRRPKSECFATVISKIDIPDQQSENTRDPLPWREPGPVFIQEDRRQFVWSVVDEAVSDPDPERRIERLIDLLKSETPATKSAAHIALYMELGPAEMAAVLSSGHRRPSYLSSFPDGEK